MSDTAKPGGRKDDRSLAPGERIEARCNACHVEVSFGHPCSASHAARIVADFAKRHRGHKA